MKRLATLILLNCTILASLFSKEVVQFSGYIRDAETNAPIPFCAVYILNENRGTITGPNGFFTFVVGKGDTVIVKSLGYKTFKIAVPSDVSSSFMKEVTIERDVVELKGVTIKPLPTPNQLRQAMINLDIPNNLQELAQQTIEQSILTDEISRNTKFDGKENFNQYVQSQVSYYYSRNGNQHPSMTFTDPFKWASFIKDIKAKKKKKESGEKYK